MLGHPWLVFLEGCVLQFFSRVVLQGSHEEGTLQWGRVVSNTLAIVGRQTHMHNRTESSGGFFLPRECSLGLWVNLMKNKDSFIVLDTGQINVWGLKALRPTRLANSTL